MNGSGQASPLSIKMSSRLDKDSMVTPGSPTARSTTSARSASTAGSLCSSTSSALSKGTLYKTIESMKKSDPEAFLGLCKMHLTFLLDLDSNKLDELFGSLGGSSSSSAPSAPRGLRLFSRKRKNSEADINIRKESLCSDWLTVPGSDRILQLIEFLSAEDSLKQEGLFRKAGHVGRQKELKDCLSPVAHRAPDTVQLDSGIVSVHDCASLLKTMLGDLPEPLLGERLYKAHCLVTGISGEGKQLKALQILMLLLPGPARSVSQALLSLLSKAAQCPENKMSAESLGMIFAPHILCPKQMTGSELHAMATQVQGAVATMIQHAEEVFMVPRDLGLDIMNHCRERQAGVSASASSLEVSQGSHSATEEKKARGRGRPKSVAVMEGEEERGEEAALNTVVTYTKRQAGDSQGMDTEIALAQLYAHVNAMPESARKHKLMKQFNEANAVGSPRDAAAKRAGTPSGKGRKRSRSLGDVIKNSFLRHRRQKSSQHLSPGGIKKNTSDSKAIGSTATPAAGVPSTAIAPSAAGAPSETPAASCQPGPSRSTADRMEITPLQSSPYMRHKLGRLRSRSKDTGLDEVEGRENGRSSRSQSRPLSMAGGGGEPAPRVPPRVPIIKQALGPWNMGASPMVRKTKPVKHKAKAEPILLHSRAITIKDGSEEMV